MEMIIGGAFQGKESYAREKYPEIKWKKGTELTEEELFAAEGVLDFQEYVRRCLLEGKELSDFSKRLFQENPDLILVSQEVGYGVVPVDAFDREYREAVGRVCTELAGCSARVTRVVCGIGMVIKGEKC
ncbi:MAG: bifunctional adenosylcobinamide kinase/adenosylcobinamide-phosphate guanylyltransferase [Clostridiales bacterium]|nr:bifunctional adenosylcobinamide kinase/adenosylcobinamide-phosphate guanylyltransferase [Clostridiales bacterium]